MRLEELVHYIQMLNDGFDELIELIENRLVVIIIKDPVPLCFWASWPGQNLARCALDRAKS